MRRRKRGLIKLQKERQDFGWRFLAIAPQPQTFVPSTQRQRECDKASRANRRGVVLAVTRSAAPFSLLRLGALNQLKVPLVFTVNRGTGDTLYFGRAT
jgi:hypothetical protein